MTEPCARLRDPGDAPARTDGCEECLRSGDERVHLRRWLACGHVGCCDDSKNRHATRRYRASGHPVIQCFEPEESWKWCFVDEVAAA